MKLTNNLRNNQNYLINKKAPIILSYIFESLKFLFLLLIIGIICYFILFLITKIGGLFSLNILIIIFNFFSILLIITFFSLILVFSFLSILLIPIGIRLLTYDIYIIRYTIGKSGTFFIDIKQNFTLNEKQGILLEKNLKKNKNIYLVTYKKRKKVFNFKLK